MRLSKTHNSTTTNKLEYPTINILFGISLCQYNGLSNGFYCFYLPAFIEKKKNVDSPNIKTLKRLNNKNSIKTRNLKL